MWCMGGLKEPQDVGHALEAFPRASPALTRSLLGLDPLFSEEHGAHGFGQIDDAIAPVPCVTFMSPRSLFVLGDRSGCCERIGRKDHIEREQRFLVCGAAFSEANAPSRRQARSSAAARRGQVWRYSSSPK